MVVGHSFRVDPPKTEKRKEERIRKKRKIRGKGFGKEGKKKRKKGRKRTKCTNKDVHGHLATNVLVNEEHMVIVISDRHRKAQSHYEKQDCNDRNRLNKKPRNTTNK